MKRYFVIIFLILCTLSSFGQEEMPSRKGKFFLIPEIWLSFGTRTYIELGPLVGYHVNDRLVVGLGPHYIYQNQQASPAYPYTFESHSFGLKGFGRFSLLTNAEEYLPVKLFSDLFVHAEYEAMSLQNSHALPGSPDSERYIYNALLLGGGFSQRVGMYNSVSLTVLWDINGTIYSPYSNPIFRVGFNAFF